MQGVISNIQRFSVHDGPGIRLSVFFQACPLECWWCHNPETIPSIKSKKWGKEHLYTPKQLMEEIRKDYIFMEESDGGVTFSGGEPFVQADFLAEILKCCKDEDIHTAIDTTGYVKTDVLKGMLGDVDLFLYDIKIVDSDLHKKYTGVSNELILKNLKFLKENDKNIIIRFPLIPEITDTEKNITSLICLMKKYELIKLNVLPYHRIADHKYDYYCMVNKMKGQNEHTKKEIIELSSHFSNAGLDVKIGG